MFMLIPIESESRLGLSSWGEHSDTLGRYWAP